MSKPLSPIDVERAVTPSAAAFDAARDVINKALVQNRKIKPGQKPTVSASLLGDQVTQDLVTAEFRQHGWDVTFKPDSRNGDYYEFESTAVAQKRATDYYAK